MAQDVWAATLRMQVARANLRPFAKSERQDPLWSESLHLVVGMAGGGTIHFCGHNHQLAAGDMLAIPWAAPVAYSASSETGLTIASIHLVPCSDGGLPPEPTTWTGSNQQARFASWHLPVLPTDVIHPTAQPNVIDLALAAVSTWSDRSRPAGWRACKLHGIATCLFAALYPSSHQASPSDAFLWWLKAAFRHRVTRSDMCRHAGLGQTALNSMVRAATGLSPTGLLIQLRLEEAQRLLSGSRMSVAEVAAAVGFRDRSHFSRLYRRRFGVSPSGISR